MGDYYDAAELIAEARNGQNRQLYADVFSKLSGKTWYYGGEDARQLYAISFDENEATITQVTFDYKGRNEKESDKYSYTVDDAAIRLVAADNSETVIAYAVSGNSLDLTDKKYLSDDEVLSDLQGFWRYRTDDEEHNIHIYGSNFTHEKARAMRSIYGYYKYYGPYSGTLTIGLGKFESKMTLGDFYWSIVGGTAKMLVNCYVCVRSNATSLPGGDYYEFWS